MNDSGHRQNFFNLVLVVLLAAGLLAGSVAAKDVTSYDGTALGTVPEFHPELGLGWLEGYLGPDALPNSLALIPRPPAPGSAALALDEETARGTFALRGTPRFKLAETDYDLRFASLMDDFSCALGTQITDASAPYLSTLLRRSVSDIGLSTYKAKNYYKRERPFQVNGEPVGVPDARAALEKDPSYPSGHTAIGWGFALLLTELSPDRTDELLARGRAYGESRIVVNHHWYSDVVWGRCHGCGNGGTPARRSNIPRGHGGSQSRSRGRSRQGSASDTRLRGGRSGIGNGIPGQRGDRNRHPARA